MKKPHDPDFDQTSSHVPSDEEIARVMSELGRRGGKRKTSAKKKASSANFAKARKAALAKRRKRGK